MLSVGNLSSPINRVLIVGLGSAGWLRDFKSQTRGCTHTFSVLDNPHFELVGGVDTKPHVAASWRSYFCAPVFGKIEDAFEAVGVDLLVIATPIEALFSTLENSLRISGDFRVLVEKPVITSQSQLGSLRGILERFGNRIIVNLPRLFSPEMLELKNSVADFGAVEQIKGHYSGDYLNTCLHLISMANHLVPNLNWRSRPTQEVVEVDIFKNEGAIGNILHNPLSSNSTFDLNFFGSHGKLSYLDGGTEIVFTRGATTRIIPNTRETYQSNVYSYLAKHGWDNSLCVSGLNRIFASIAHLLNIPQESI